MSLHYDGTIKYQERKVERVQEIILCLIMAGNKLLNF